MGIGKPIEKTVFKNDLRLIENRNYLFRKPKMHFPRTG